MNRYDPAKVRAAVHTANILADLPLVDHDARRTVYACPCGRGDLVLWADRPHFGHYSDPDCKWRGFGPIDAYMLVHDVGFPTALEQLAQLVGIDPEPTEQRTTRDHVDAEHSTQSEPRAIDSSPVGTGEWEPF